MTATLSGRSEAGQTEAGLPVWRRSREAGLAFRQAADADMPFLAALYASTRLDELAPTGWSEGQKAHFLAQQFAAQHRHYMQHYADAVRLVVESRGAPIGRLYLARWPREHRIVDIAFLPAHRGRGFGTALLGDLIDEADAARKAVTIHVEKNNPARKLYLRLGFAIVEDKGVYDLMACPAAAGGGHESFS